MKGAKDRRATTHNDQGKSNCGEEEWEGFEPTDGTRTPGAVKTHETQLSHQAARKAEIKALKRQGKRIGKQGLKGTKVASNPFEVLNETTEEEADGK